MNVDFRQLLVASRCISFDLARQWILLTQLTGEHIHKSSASILEPIMGASRVRAEEAEEGE